MLGNRKERENSFKCKIKVNKMAKREGEWEWELINKKENKSISCFKLSFASLKDTLFCSIEC